MLFSYSNKVIHVFNYTIVKKRPVVNKLQLLLQWGWHILQHLEREGTFRKGWAILFNFGPLKKQNEPPLLYI